MKAGETIMLPGRVIDVSEDGRLLVCDLGPLGRRSVPAESVRSDEVVRAAISEREAATAFEAACAKAERASSPGRIDSEARFDALDAEKVVRKATRALAIAADALLTSGGWPTPPPLTPTDPNDVPLS